jgi:ATP-dependent DNA helicase RecG
MTLKNLLGIKDLAGLPLLYAGLPNFGQPGITDYRNPHLAEVMKNFGFVQRLGFGIPIARQELEKNGNRPPEFRVEESHILVIIRRRP